MTRNHRKADEGGSREENCLNGVDAYNGVNRSKETEGGKEQQRTQAMKVTQNHCYEPNFPTEKPCADKESEGKTKEMCKDQEWRGLPPP